jgi:hypothetical protein
MQDDKLLILNTTFTNQDQMLYSKSDLQISKPS